MSSNESKPRACQAESNPRKSRHASKLRETKISPNFSSPSRTGKYIPFWPNFNPNLWATRPTRLLTSLKSIHNTVQSGQTANTKSIWNSLYSNDQTSEFFTRPLDLSSSIMKPSNKDLLISALSTTMSRSPNDSLSEYAATKWKWRPTAAINFDVTSARSLKYSFFS